jgi:predicted Zn-dependent protease
VGPFIFIKPGADDLMKTAARLAFLAVLAGCSTNPYTGRSQLMLVDKKTERELGVSAYQEVLAQNRISTSPAEVDPLRRVGRRIASTVNEPDFQWEFSTIVDDKTMNAFCLPGGKIAFYTGIFPVLEDEAGMAFVMGHEVGHALMHHGAERMSQDMVAGGAAAMVGAALGAKDPMHSQAAMAAFGVATQVGVLLPYSREHESEADRVGLELMAKAGYDPRASVRVWRKMSQMSKDQPPEWLSTHPSHESRIADLESRMSDAVRLYEKSTRATVARLPAIQHREGKKSSESLAAGLVPAQEVHVRLGPAKLETLEDRRTVVQFEVQFDRDVFVDKVDVQGPRVGRKTLSLKSGVPGGEKKKLVLPQEYAVAPPLEPGDYMLMFHGTASGKPFSASAEAEVK